MIVNVRVGIVRSAMILFVSLLSASVTAQPAPILSSRLGITFISSLDHPANELRYQRALLLGAGWNRWPLYWDQVERSPGVFDWSSYDRLVRADLEHGLRLNVILLGRPGFHANGGSIGGLNAPVFSDGTDEIGPGKQINGANPWAVFVSSTVLRYKPGGSLAVQLGWPAERGVSVWEAWNEPDLPLFWTGGVEQYARLLKVTYLAVHQADPNAEVMFGGLAYGNPDENDWLAKVLDVLAGDPSSRRYNTFFDSAAVHNYSYARRSGLVVERVQKTLRQYDLNQPVWLNESGVPVWDDYPGPTWAANDPASRQYRATLAQQAAFVIQSTVLAWAAGAEVVFYHQLYDDCGNQPGGTDFAPHNGERCVEGAICAGDAFGLYRNLRGESCFSQHPLPGTPRPAAAAYYRLAQVFGVIPFDQPQVEARDGATLVSFERPSTGERIVVVWNRRLERTNLNIPAVGRSAQLYSAEEDYVLTPTDGQYTLGLLPATRDDFPNLPEGETAAIGGPPLILIERRDPSLNLITEATPLILTPGAITATQPPRPTTDPALDTTPPTTSMTPLPVISPPTFTVSWSGQDDSGIERYLVWVRVDGGEWKPWLETASTQGQYTGEAGKSYAFAVWAVDLAGNWSLNTDLSPQAVTTVQQG